MVVHLADDEQYPHRLAEDVEEERRLFHVAITRASTHATIVTGPTSEPVRRRTHQRTVGTSSRVVAPSRTGPGAARRRRQRRRRTTWPRRSTPRGSRRFEALKELRNELRDGKPAYVVFDNKTLVAIARTVPSTLTELSRISGVGPAKLEQYGEAVISLLAAAGVTSGPAGRTAHWRGYGGRSDGRPPPARAPDVARPAAHVGLRGCHPGRHLPDRHVARAPRRGSRRRSTPRRSCSCSAPPPRTTGWPSRSAPGRSCSASTTR